MSASTPKRFEWIDNARVFAALLIMYVHLPTLILHLPPPIDNKLVMNIFGNLTYEGRVPFFLILAGYFLSRNITWKKAWDRFIWLFIPYLIWNLLAYLFCKWDGTTIAEGQTILGIGSILIEQLSISEQAIQCPFIGPAWFLRDIMILSLLTPLIVKFRFLLIGILLICAAFLPLNLHPSPFVAISIGATLFYCLGICLGNFKIEDAYRIFTPKFTIVVIMGAIVGIAIGLKNALISGEGTITQNWSLTLIGLLFGAMMIAHCGVLIERYLPKVSQKLSLYAPACFLVFMLHDPLYTRIEKILPDCIKESYWGLLIPIPIFFLIVGFYLAMKKYTPKLLPYLAHVKN